jgi:RNA polymerase sigma-70 factor (ECF subfamily)
VLGLQVTLDDQQLTNALVSRCVAGDASAWEEIVRVHNRRVYNICYRFTGSPDDADDLTQEVFIKVYRTLKSYDLGKGAFTTWLTTVTRNLLVDHFRRSKQDRVTDSIDSSPQSEEDSPTLGDTLQDQTASPDETLAAKEKQQLVQEALAKLSPDLREAVILRDLQDMDYKEIAAALKVPEGTVKSRINRGRTELARILSRTYKQVI